MTSTQSLDTPIQIRGLTKTYANGFQALKGVNLDIPMGMFGLLGPNGAGKSSLMRTIATLQEASEGTIQWGDINVLEDVYFAVMKEISARDLHNPLPLRSDLRCKLN